MLSSSRSKAKGFSLSCCGSDLCRTRGPGAAPASRSVRTGVKSESRSTSGCFPGTGVQGCQEELAGARHSALRSSATGLCWDWDEEPPGLPMDVDRMKDISCKDRGGFVRAVPGAVWGPAPGPLHTERG